MTRATSTETVHRVGNTGLTLCCRRPVLELPRTDRITLDPLLATCPGPPRPGGT